MKTYCFDTKVTMKPYNANRFWINRDYVGYSEITADNLSEALSKWVEKCEDCCVTISKNAMKNKEPMYIDTKDGESVQVGYVITGQTEIADYDSRRYTKQYIDLWVTIKEISYARFDEAV